MSIYIVYEVKNGDKLFTANLKKKEVISHSRIKDFQINKDVSNITVSGKDYVKSFLSTDTNEIIDEINFKMTFTRHNFIYCIIGLDGRGIMTVHGYAKYIKDNLIEPVEKYLKGKINSEVKIEQFRYDNEHFSKEFWGEKVTTELAYYSSEKLHIRISCKNFYQFIDNNPNLKKYFLEGTIKSVKGFRQELQYPVGNLKQMGLFKFDRQGQFHLDFFDIDFFNNFIKKLIDQKFFRRDEV
jgi:hypothetical protein